MTILPVPLEERWRQRWRRFLKYLCNTRGTFAVPTLDDMKEGIIAARIAAHAGDIAKGVKGARIWDDSMSQARADVDFNKMIALSIDPEKAKAYRESSLPGTRGHLYHVW